MSSDPLEARLRLRQLLARPFGEASLDGEDLRAVLDELDRLLRYRQAQADPGGPLLHGPPPAPQNHTLARRLAEELGRPEGAGRITRRQLAGLLSDWQRLMRLEPYLQHLPACPLHRADPWAHVGYEGLRATEKTCTCGFHKAYAAPPTQKPESPAPAAPPAPPPAAPSPAPSARR
jgi:hypothetical protein